MKNLIWTYEITNSDVYISKTKAKIGKVLKIIFKIFKIDFEKIKQYGKKFINSYLNEKCDNVCNLSTSYNLESIPKNIFSPPKKVKFEDMEVNIPNNYDKYLKIIYGDDYMELPPKEKRHNHRYAELNFGHY